MRKNFTLIELLVVIAIIGILSSILLPELANARQKGFQTVCLNNVKQAALAVIMYAQDNNMYAPSDDSDTNGERWFNKLQLGYLPKGTENNNSSPALSCPTAKDITTNWESQLSLNSYTSGKNQGGSTINATSLNSASHETSLFMDSYDNWRSIKSAYMTVNQLLTTPDNIRVAKHSLKANVGFYDGSARALPATTLLQYNDNKLTFWDPSK